MYYCRGEGGEGGPVSTFSCGQKTTLTVFAGLNKVIFPRFEGKEQHLGEKFDFVHFTETNQCCGLSLMFGVCPSPRKILLSLMTRILDPLSVSRDQP